MRHNRQSWLARRDSEYPRLYLDAALSHREGKSGKGRGGKGGRKGGNGGGKGGEDTG